MSKSYEKFLRHREKMGILMPEELAALLGGTPTVKQGVLSTAERVEQEALSLIEKRWQLPYASACIVHANPWVKQILQIVEFNSDKKAQVTDISAQSADYNPDLAISILLKRGGQDSAKIIVSKDNGFEILEAPRSEILNGVLETLGKKLPLRPVSPTTHGHPSAVLRLNT